MLARLVSYNIATSSVSQAKQVVFTVELIDVLSNPPSMRDKLCKGEGGQFAIPSFRQVKLSPSELAIHNERNYIKHVKKGYSESEFVPQTVAFRKERLLDLTLERGQQVTLKMYIYSCDPLQWYAGDRVVLSGVEQHNLEGHVPSLGCRSMITEEQHNVEEEIRRTRYH
jgi:hypothetical protein